MRKRVGVGRKITAENFVMLLSKFNTVELLGICRLLGVRFEKDMEASDVVAQLIDHFMRLKKKPQRELWSMLRAAATQPPMEVEQDGTGAENC